MDLFVQSDMNTGVSMKIITIPTKTLTLLLLLSLNQNSFATPININTADAQSIATSLSGIGEYKAQAIIHYRQKNGLFKKAIDIVKVKGIGRATYNKNKSDILLQ